MLELNPEIVCQIIAKAREYQTREALPVTDDETEVTLEDWDPEAPDTSGADEDLTLLEIKTTIEDLEPDQQAALVALMWVGRGNYDADDWDAALADAQDRATVDTADYLLSTPLAADYLEEGLSALGYSCEE